MLQLARGFTQSRIFISGAELDIFTLLDKEARTAEEVGAIKNAGCRGMTILLDALTAQGFLVKQDGRYRTEASVAPFLSADSPDTILPMVLYSADLWERWSKLTPIILGNAEPSLDDGNADEILQNLVKAMHAVNYPKASETVAQIQPGAARNLLDVGGGAGTYAMAFLREMPAMRATLFDFPAIAAIAREQFQAAGLGERTACVAGDYLKDELPEGHDIALLSAVIHQHGPEENAALYAKVYRALNPGGRIVIRGFVMSDDKTEPMPGAMFAVNMLTSTLGGQTYSFDEIKAGLEQAGFTGARLLLKADGLFSLVDAIKPGI